MVKEITSVDQFNSEILKDKVLVDLNAIWCGPCQMLSPIIEQFSEENKDVNVLSVNVDLLPDVASKYGVMSIPTLLYIEKGNLINTSIGYVSLDKIKELCKK